MRKKLLLSYPERALLLHWNRDLRAGKLGFLYVVAFIIMYDNNDVDSIKSLVFILGFFFIRTLPKITFDCLLKITDS